MSEVYSVEPKTSGKVIIYTSLGELEIHLFSNECPVACKNFIQLCLNNYYNKNKFFRVIPKFLIQTGDHTNTGLHNEYAFKEPFPNECNSRLKFLYMGCVAFANLNIDNPSNGSQFFITLDKAESLNNKSTLFGKVAKHSLYNLMKFNDIKTNKNDEPIEDVPYIEYIKVIENPFHHLIPSINYEENKTKQKKDDSSETKPKKSLKKNLLSFAHEGNDEYQDEEDEEREREKEWEREQEEEDEEGEKDIIEDEEKDIEKEEEEEEKEEEREQRERDKEEEKEEDDDETAEMMPKKSRKKNLLSTPLKGSNGYQDDEDEEREREKEWEREQEEEDEEGEKDIIEDEEKDIEKEEEEEEKEEEREERERDKEEEKEEDGETDGENEMDNGKRQGKINLLKKKTAEIEKLNPNKNKNVSSLKKITDLDEEYIKKIKKHKKMSKKERENESVKKLKEFDSRLKDLFSKDDSKHGASKPDWINTTGLKFRIDSSNAYDHEDLKKNVVDSMDNERKETYNPNFNMKKYKKKGEK
ncbi:peptidyl-prolyl cis-trans isomerase, putative [Plasmodium chabaudi chabaudi]|uniref:Peptidyl-prolyl cis-trans isomerase, putative n=1 Tax=Plasmodium chabaudi chabaudi TaxID=31271 RepID=A0A1C6XEY4_PLACU|nr:peptidyl-prolyl cis-trans isomerase, putative [Plasmodium chabaudi chabaudi]